MHPWALPLRNWPFWGFVFVSKENKEARVVTMYTAMPEGPIGRFVFEMCQLLTQDCRVGDGPDFFFSVGGYMDRKEGASSLTVLSLVVCSRKHVNMSCT